MGTVFDTLAAAEALEAVGIDTRQAKVLAIQLGAAASAGDPVTQPEMESALYVLRTDMERALDVFKAEFKTEIHAALAAQKLELLDRMSAMFWRLFGGMVAMASLTVAAIRYLP